MAHETVPADINEAIVRFMTMVRIWDRAPFGKRERELADANEARAALNAVIIKHLHRTEALCELARNDADLIGIA